jgi:hypothetical protein
MLRTRAFATTAFVLLGAVSFVAAQAPAPGTQGGGRTGAPAAGAPAGAPAQGARAGGPARRPGLFFKEDWKQIPKGGENPIVQDHVANTALELKLYGPNAKEMAITGNAGDENNPIHVWTGLCTGPCAVLLRDKTNFADLTGLARIRWNTKMSGFHQIRPAVKLADGNMYVADKADGSTRDWIVSEINFADLKWLKMDPARAVTTGNILDKIDLSKVDEVGFVDLMPGSGHGAGGWVDVAQIELYANKVAR